MQPPCWPPLNPPPEGPKMQLARKLFEPPKVGTTTTQPLFNSLYRKRKDILTKLSSWEFHFYWHHYWHRHENTFSMCKHKQKIAVITYQMEYEGIHSGYAINCLLNLSLASPFSSPQLIKFFISHVILSLTQYENIIKQQNLPGSIQLHRFKINPNSTLINKIQQDLGFMFIQEQQAWMFFTRESPFYFGCLEKLNKALLNLNIENI